MELQDVGDPRPAPSRRLLPLRRVVLISLTRRFFDPLQAFAACTTFDNLLSGEESGLLGLGWQPLSTSRAVPFIQQLWQQGDLTNPLFGLGYDSNGGGT